MININSPLVQAKHDLIRMGGHPDAVADLDHEIRADVQSRLDRVRVGIEDVSERILELPERPSLRKQYKEAINLYRVLQALVVEVRGIKKDIRQKLGIGGKNEK